MLVLPGELTVYGVASAPDLGTVHDVVVDQCERVHELECGGGVDDRGIVEIATRAH